MLESSCPFAKLPVFCTGTGIEELIAFREEVALAVVVVDIVLSIEVLLFVRFSIEYDLKFNSFVNNLLQSLLDLLRF